MQDEAIAEKPCIYPYRLNKTLCEDIDALYMCILCEISWSLSPQLSRTWIQNSFILGNQKHTQIQCKKKIVYHMSCTVYMYTHTYMIIWHLGILHVHVRLITLSLSLSNSLFKNKCEHKQAVCAPFYGEWTLTWYDIHKRGRFCFLITYRCSM